MSVVLALFFIVIMIATGSALVSRRQHQLTAPSPEARLQHLRSGEYPSTCTWCRNTTLARRLFIFERLDREWRATDLMTRLATSDPAEAEQIAGVFSMDSPRWRRLCTEKCASEFLHSVQATNAPTFQACEYCSIRIPTTLQRCNSCGAPVKGAAS